MSGDEREQRKRNFSSEECAILTTSIVKFDHILHGKGSANTSAAKKKDIMRRVTEKVNSVSLETRTMKEVDKKWSDMKRRTRDKLRAIKAHARGTGGGSPCKIKLTPQDEQIATVLSSVQVQGVEGVDSMEDRMDAGSTSTSAAASSTVAKTPNIPDTPSVEEHSELEQDDPEDVEIDLSPTTLDQEEVPEPEREEVVTFVVDQTNLPLSLEGDVTISGYVQSIPSPVRGKHEKRLAVPRKDDRKVIWENTMLQEQAQQTKIMGDIQTKMSEVAETIANASSDNTSSLLAVEAAVTSGFKAQRRSSNLMSSSIADVAANCAATVTALGTVGDSVDTQKSALDKLVDAVTQLTKAVQHNTAAVRNEGRHTRRLMRQHTQMQSRLQADSFGALNRIAHAIESLQAPSESRSTTPASTAPSGDEVQPPTAFPDVPVSTSRSGGVLGLRARRGKQGKH